MQVSPMPPEPRTRPTAVPLGVRSSHYKGGNQRRRTPHSSLKAASSQCWRLTARIQLVVATVVWWTNRS